MDVSVGKRGVSDGLRRGVDVSDGLRRGGVGVSDGLHRGDVGVSDGLRRGDVGVSDKTCLGIFLFFL